MSSTANLPDWCDSINEWANYIYNSHGESVNIPTVGSKGRGVHIGIIDTVKNIPEEYSDCDIGHEISVLQNMDEDRTSNHGLEVFNMISAYAPDATFSFIQASESNHSISIQAYYEAIQKSIEIGVDILNISADDSSTGPIHSNPYAKYTQMALDEEIIVVGATGNWYPDREQPPIGCPAAMDDTIGVGGYVTKCPCEPSESSESDPSQGPYFALTEEDEEYYGIVAEGSFCGQTYCCDGTDCIVNSTEEEWGRNSLPTDGGPDILAPVHYPRVNSNDMPYIVAGTSYAAPIVTAALAIGYAECVSDL